MEPDDREEWLRQKLRARGLEMRRSKGAAPPGNLGKYMVFDPVTGGSLLGHRFDADLADIERWLPDE